MSPELKRQASPFTSTWPSFGRGGGGDESVRKLNDQTIAGAGEEIDRLALKRGPANRRLS